MELDLDKRSFLLAPLARHAQLTADGYLRIAAIVLEYLFRAI